MEFLYCIVNLVLSGIIVFVIRRIYPRKWIKENKFPFKPFHIEKEGNLYKKFKIQKWKTKLPDASLILNKIFPRFVPKKRLDELTKEKIEVLIKENCVAESTHLCAAVLGLLCIKIWKNIGGILIAIIYFFWNSLFVMIQRYNRPRLIKALNFLTHK